MSLNQAGIIVARGKLLVGRELQTVYSAKLGEVGNKRASHIRHSLDGTTINQASAVLCVLFQLGIIIIIIVNLQFGGNKG